MTETQKKTDFTRARTIHIIVAVVLGIATFVSICFTLFFGVARGETVYLKMIIINIGLMFSDLLLACCCFNNSDSTGHGHTFAAIAVLLFANFLFSGILDILNGTASARGVLFVLETVSYIFSAVTQMMFWVYQCAAFPKNRVQRIFTRWVFSLFFLYLVLIVVNVFTGFLFHVDETGKIVFSGMAIDAFVVLAFYASYLCYILPQRYPVKKKVIVASFAFFPIAFLVIGMIWYACGGKYNISSGFYMFMLLAAYVVFFGDYIENKERVLLQKAELAELECKQTELQTTLMLSQIRPHFLYNSITAIRNLCKNEPAEAYVALGQFADYLRGNMDALENGRMISFKKELEHIKAYLSLEQMRFEDELQVEYDIRFSDFCLPALTVQPIVENAVRHGATMNENGGKITICAEKTNEGTVITVTDNGPGFDPTVPRSDGKNHFGIANVRNCLAAKNCGMLEIDSTIGVGTVVTILIWEEKNEHTAC